MEVETALTIADSLVFAKTGKHLNTLQTEIFRGAWLGQKYEQIAEANYCSDSHVKMIGATLWDILSEGLAEKITKKNFRAVLERRRREELKIQNLESETDELDSSKTADLELKQGDRDLTPIEKPNTVFTTLTTELELPEGQVQLGSKFYIERPPIETRCYETILKPGSLIRIKAPRQMGKSSLMVRILTHASQQDYRTVTINFQLADSRIFQDLDLFLKWFCVSVSKGLGLSNQVAEYWDDIFGSKMSCKDYFENYLLAQLEQPLVLALEEVDCIFQHSDLADDFFPLLRSWHEEAKSNPIWQKLRLILVHSTEVYIPLNINQSPFNVGLPVELPEFNSSQVRDLAQRHGLDWNLEQVELLMKFIGGHPYLVRKALYHLVKKQQTLEELFSLADTETSPFSNHLRRHLWHLQKQPHLVAALQTVLNSATPVRLDFVEMFKLHSMGLVHLRGNKVTPRCELYRQYFSDRLLGIK